VACYTCLLLRLAMAACDYEEEKIAPWDIPELHGEIRDKILKSTQTKGHSSKWGFAKRTEAEEVQRIPFIMSQHVRIAIYDHKKCLANEVSAPFMLKFNGLLDGFVGAYNNQEQMFKTPMPFPMVQMARTMMFLWIYSLPFALSTDSSTLYVHCAIVFLLTYAFMGLETVSLQLDDPFGHDENDFDNLGMAKIIFEDVISSIDIVDGPEWAYKVRVQMKGADDDLPTEDTALLGRAMV
jgi:predicted membrane chloride channel (bestrophin family)